ncbi:MAG: YncE family protein [Acidobacteria bacterium]|nr:YncE family protein [Acidobacteriota bacterium]
MTSRTAKLLLVPIIGPIYLVAQSLDFTYFRDRVQPVFLKQRPGHARCISCHTHRSPPLEPLSPGAATWTEEQSRKNFAVWRQFVVPGHPLKSVFLRHPLAEVAGGDRFHGGGKHWQSQEDPEWQVLAGWVRGRREGGAVVRVLQSNSAGDSIAVIDPATNEIVGRIGDIEVPHGVVIAPGGERIYVTNEARTTLDVVESKTLAVSKRIPLSGRPNNVAVGNDGRFVYVGIRQGSGAVDVIDTRALTNMKSVPVKGEIHNVYVTPDGKHVVAGSIAASTISVIDVATHTLAWTLTLNAGIRPMAFTKHPDGGTKDIIVQLSDFHGFALVDFRTRREVRRITLPDPPGEHKETQGLQGSPSHGMAITPDEKMLWATSKYYDSVMAYSLPDYKLLGVVKVGLHPDWLTIPPDGKRLFVAAAGDDMTVVVDIATRKVVQRIPVGAVPKRNASGVLRME